MSDVPCNGCTACCRRDRIPLHPERGDRVMLLDAERDDQGQYWVKRKADGSCRHLTDSGCAVHAFKPVECREFDCRETMRLYLSLPREQRRALQKMFDAQGIFGKDIRKAARARLHTL